MDHILGLSSPSRYAVLSIDLCSLVVKKVGLPAWASPQDRSYQPAGNVYFFLGQKFLAGWLTVPRPFTPRETLSRFFGIPPGTRPCWPLSSVLGGGRTGPRNPPWGQGVDKPPKNGSVFIISG